MRFPAILALALVGCSSFEKAHVPIDRALAKLVPPDTTALAGIRLDQLQKLPYYDKLLTLGPSGGMSQFLKDTGMDARSDLAELLVTSNGKSTVALLRGKFSPASLGTELEAKGARQMPYKGFTVIGSDSRAILFIDESTAIAGQPAVLQSTVDHRGEFTGVPPLLERQLESVDTSSQIWAVSLGGFLPGLQDSRGNWGNAGRLLERTRRFVLAATLDGGLVFKGEGECASGQDAKDLEGVTRGMLGIARFASRKNAALRSLYDTISVSRQERSVFVAAKVPAAVFEELLSSGETKPRGSGN